MNKKQIVRVALSALCIVLVATMGMGCKSKKPSVIETGPLNSDSGTGGPENQTGTGEGLPNINLADVLFNSNNPSGLQLIYFDFDSSSLRPDALETLRQNAEKIKKNPNVIIQVAGHCDERGTQEYNLALGERRALSVRSHLIQLGVSGDRMITISYGEEFPAEPGSSEAVWAKNRRCEFNQAQMR
jgi:peptidoglycan-associated lipoprotein